MSVNRRELLSKLNKMVTAEVASQPSIDISRVDDADSPIEEGEEETLAQSPIPLLSGNVGLGVSILGE